MLRKTLALIALTALVCVTGGWPVTMIAGPGTGGGTGTGGAAGILETMNEQFTGGIGSWIGRNGGICTYVGPSQIDLETSGICVCSTCGQPTTADQWAVAEYGAGTTNFSGVGVRHKASVATGSDYNFAARVNSNGTMVIRQCNTDDSCTDIGTSTSVNGVVQPDDGDQIALMVAGSSGSVELCAWFWDAAETDETWSDPSTWKAATMCKSQGASITALAAYSDCGVTTACQGSQTFNVPDPSQTWITLYRGATFGSEFEWFRGGEI